MTTMSRRDFVQITATSYLLGSLKLARARGSSKITRTEKTVTVAGKNFTWEWSQENDRFRILDQKGRTIATAVLQPAVVVQPAGQKGARHSTAGRLASHEAQDNRVSWTYEGVNGTARLSVAWRFDEYGPWAEPVTYETTAAEDIVSLHYFAQAAGDGLKGSLETRGLVLPGICESPAVSPVIGDGMGWDLTSWLGRGATGGSGLLQQWGLPAHYFCGFRGNEPLSAEGASTKSLSEAFCCGLADLPNGDLFLNQKGDRASLVVDLRGDLWGHLRGPNRFTLGATLFWAFGPNYYEAIRQYYLGLLRSGVIHRKINSVRKNAVALAPQWCTWGEQVARGKEGNRLDQTVLTQMYGELKASGLQAGMFSIDDKWEGRYGNLEASAERFPHFEQFLDRIRADGRRIGLWAAFMRCEDPAELGLTPAQMLRRTDGQPYLAGESTKYYILDFTRPEVSTVLRDRARRFVRRYRPDLVKFDFGYEIPALDTAAPHDMSWAGERLLWKGLDVVVKALQEENPDIVVMYYELSPLFTDYFDLHSPDDLFMATGEFDLEANRRFFFSSLCGEIGMPTYGSSGYDWVSQPEIWFDSVVIGTLGCLGAFSGTNQAEDSPSPELLSKYNGLTHLVRPTNEFSIIPLDAMYDAPTRGAHASSWARLEKDEVVLLALRQRRLDGRPGTGKFRDLVSTDTSVVVASKTDEGIGRCSKLGIVPYGDGQLTLRRQSRLSTQADVTEHYFGGLSTKSRVAVSDGLLAIPLKERAAGGTPVEWLEVEIHVQ